MRPRATSKGSTSAADMAKIARYEEFANKPHQSGGENAPGGGKAPIAPQPLCEGRMTDEAKADGRDRQAEKPTGHSLQHQGSQHHWDVGPKRDHQSGRRNHRRPERDEHLLRTNDVEQFST